MLQNFPIDSISGIKNTKIIGQSIMIIMIIIQNTTNKTDINSIVFTLNFSIIYVCYDRNQ